MARPNQNSPTRPYNLDLGHLGHIQGLTYTSPCTSSSSPSSSPSSSSSSTKDLCHYIGGLPYALPPIGPYRWRQARTLPACYRYGTKANPGVFVGGAGVCPQPAFTFGKGGSAVPNPLFDEDCLQLNVWVPVGKPKDEKGWPVLFYIHGGFLQFGTPNTENFLPLLSSTPAQCIIVCPAYRVNLFGFLASRELAAEAERNGEPVGNYGFWDQRLALEWCYRNVSCFAGDPGRIFVGGHSAGAHSSFHQLAFDLFRTTPSINSSSPSTSPTSTSTFPSSSSSSSPTTTNTNTITSSKSTWHTRPRPPIIKSLLLFSNGSGLQPKPLSAAQPQFDSLLHHLSIPLSLSPAEKMSRLRSTPFKNLLAAIEKTEWHEYRAITDGDFIRKELFADIESGLFAKKLLERGIKIVIGEVPGEHNLYAAWRPPHSNTLESLQERLSTEYPAAAISALLKHYCPDGELPTHVWPDAQTWTPDVYGRLYAELQVHAMERGFIGRLVEAGAGGLVYRYRVEYRAKCCDAQFPREWGVTHGTDTAGVWFFGKGIGNGLTQGEKEGVQGFAGAVWEWLGGSGLDRGGGGKEGEVGGKKGEVARKEFWGTDEEGREIRRLRGDLVTDIVRDDLWEKGVQVWDIVRRAQDEAEKKTGSKL